jgi:hypothetical protein
MVTFGDSLKARTRTGSAVSVCSGRVRRSGQAEACMRSAATASTLPARLQRWAPFWVADGDDSISRKPASSVLESLGNGRPASCHARPLDHPVRFSFGILDLPSQQQMREPIGTNSRLVNSSSPEMLSDRQGHAWSTLVCFLSPVSALPMALGWHSSSSGQSPPDVALLSSPNVQPHLL